MTRVFLCLHLLLDLLQALDAWAMALNAAVTPHCTLCYQDCSHALWIRIKVTETSVWCTWYANAFGAGTGQTVANLTYGFWQHFSRTARRRKVTLIFLTIPMVQTVTLYVVVDRPATWQAVAPCTLWTMQVKDLDTVVDLYPDLAPVLQEAFHQHLKNQAKRTPGKAW